jgi:hypothetical protein
MSKVSLEYKVFLYTHDVIFLDDKRRNWARIHGISYVSSMILCIKNLEVLPTSGQVIATTLRNISYSNFSADWQVISASKSVNTRGTTREPLNEFL